MKIRTFACLTAGVLALSATAFSQGSSGRIVMVDLNRVFNEYYKTPIASAKLKETVDNYNKEQEAMMEQYKRQTAELDKLREDSVKPEYTQEVRDQKKKAVTEKLGELKKTQDDITEFKRTHQLTLDQNSQRMRKTILGEIQDVIARIAKDAGYSLVLDKSGNTLNGVSTVVYSQDSMDITDSIIKMLNRDQPKTTDTPKPAEKKSETK